MEEDKFNDMVVNFEKVKKGNYNFAVTKLLVYTLQENPYLTIGKFIGNLSNADLRLLQDVSSNDVNTNPEFEQILLISYMLAAAEGCTSEGIDKVTEHCNMLVQFLTLESLYRKGLIEVFHDNMSFGDDARNKIIAKPIAKPSF
jgi:hypothetical protein